MLRRLPEEGVGASVSYDRWGGGDQLGQMVRQAMVTVAVLKLHEGESLT